MAWLVLLLLALAFLLAPRWGLRHRWRQWRRLRTRRRLEDALKHLFEADRRKLSPTLDSLAGALRLPRSEVASLVERMESNGLLKSLKGALELTPAGKDLAFQIVRAHRLLETYLAEEAGMPLREVHRTAERAEHDLSAETIEALDARLGHPDRDPHGDPIPLADGSISDEKLTPLTDVTTGESLYIAHVEDEPDSVFRRISALALRPGDPIRVLDHGPDFVVIEHHGRQRRISPVVAANVHVRRSPVAPEKPADAVTLADLATGARAEVVGLDPSFRGLARRRLLDLGLTPGAHVTAALANAFGDPRAYEVRGTLIALRSDQARMVWVRPVNGTGDSVPSQEATA